MPMSLVFLLAPSSNIPFIYAQKQNKQTKEDKRTSYVNKFP